ncbi:MAG: hypothetical protein Q9176_006490 [Flavoplaca citrina]
MVFAQLDAIRYYQPPFSVAKPNRNRSLARKSGLPNTQSKDDASRTSMSCTNNSVRIDGYDVIECLDLTESPPSITLQGQAGALVRAKPAVGKSNPKLDQGLSITHRVTETPTHRFDSDADFPTIKHIKARLRDAPTVQNPVHKAVCTESTDQGTSLDGFNFPSVLASMHTETLDDHDTGDETRPEHIREDVPPERKLQQAS